MGGGEGGGGGGGGGRGVKGVFFLAFLYWYGKLMTKDRNNEHV